jgi:hypothetical protein
VQRCVNLTLSPQIPFSYSMYDRTFRVRKGKENHFDTIFVRLKVVEKAGLLLILCTFILGDMKKEGLYIDDNVYSTS